MINFSFRYLHASLMLFCLCLGTFHHLDGSSQVDINNPGHLNKKSKGRKKQCVLYGNCQMGVVYDYLRKEYPDLYQYTMIVNYDVLRKPEQFPVDSLKKADLFIFQPIIGHGNADTAYIKQNLLNEKCHCISFPYIYFSGYFPDYTEDLNNLRTFSEQFPFGIFSYGHKKIIEFIKLGYSPNQIIEKSFQHDLFSEDFINENLKKTLSILEEKESAADIKIAGFIRKYFKKKRLFHTVNHPTNIILKRLVKEILLRMNLNISDVDKNVFFRKEVLATQTTDIIYPSVAIALGLEFDISTAICFSNKIAFAEYINDYIKYLYPEYYTTFNAN